MEVRLLGSVEISGPQGQVDLGAPQQRCVFAALALVPGQSLTIDALVKRVWGEAVPVDVRAMLYTYVSRLRGALQEADPVGGRDSLRRRDGGYALDVDPEKVDLHRARRLAGEARALAQQDEAGDRVAADLLGQACSLWTGMPLAGIDSDWVRRVRTGLEQERLAMLTERFAAAVRIGQHDTVLGPLSQSVADKPLDESLAELLMLALYRSGRQADALEVYAQLHRRLVDELGDGPGCAVRRLHELILRRDPGLAARQQQPEPVEERPAALPARDGDPRPAAAPWVSLCQLPPDSPRFVGRRALVADLSAVLAAEPSSAVQVVVVSGPPGIGKTALATRVAHRVRERFPDGQWYVQLGGAAAARETSGLLAELLEATGLDPASIPGGLERRAAALRARLADRRVLLLLDDAREASQVRALLPGTGGSAVLVTSRWLLSGLDDAASARLGPLGEAEAAALLGEWAGGDRLAAEPGATRDVVAACGANPLALRIAAARLALHPRWPVSQFAPRLGDPLRRLDELEAGDLAVRAGLQDSYRSLDEPLQVALRRLGLVAGHDVAAWTVGVLAGVRDALRPVEGLVAASLLEPAGTDATGQPRYRLQPLVADYAAELARQDDPSETRAALRRRLDVLLALADACYRRPRGSAGQQAAGVHGTRGYLCDAEAARLTAEPVTWLRAEHEQLLEMLERACRLGWYAAAARLAERVLTDALRPVVGSQEFGRLLTTVRDAALRAGDQAVAERMHARLQAETGVQGPVVPFRLEVPHGLPAFERLDA